MENEALVSGDGVASTRAGQEGLGFVINREDGQRQLPQAVEQREGPALLGALRRPPSGVAFQ